jgi:transcription initiation factor TFIIH subunit 2
MADSDGEYVEEYSDDETAHQVTRRGRPGTRSTARSGRHSRRGAGGAPRVERKAAWEDIHRSWDTVVEAEDGSISRTVEGLVEAGKRKR